MTAATAEKPAAKGAAKGSVEDLLKPKSSLLPAPIEEINAGVAQVMEDMGVWKKLASLMNNNLAIKDHVLKVCNMQGLPLIGVDIIPTQQGLKLYVNSEGAKFNRERYLDQQGRRMIERKIELIPYEQMPGSDPVKDKAQGRIYFRITTTIEDVEQKAKIVDAVCKGTIPADKVESLLEQLKIVTKYQTHSSFSNQSEKFGDNRQPDAILKKGTTQCHRRADLEISSQCVIPEDEEPKDAEFVIRDATPARPDAAELAKKVAQDLPPVTLTPTKVTEVKTAQEEQKPQGQGNPPSTELPVQTPEEVKEIEAVMGQINAVFTAAKIAKPDRMKWFTEHGYPLRKTEMTPTKLKEALAKVKAQYEKPAAVAGAGGPAAAAQEPAKKADPDPARGPEIQKMFGLREKAGFASEEALREWVKTRFGKGMSEMAAGELAKVGDTVKEFANTLEDTAKWGFTTAAELITYVQETEGKDFHLLTSEDLAKVVETLNGLLP